MNRIKDNELFKKYYDFLIEENNKYNLTSITKEDEVYIKHFYDSIQLEKIASFENKISLCDVGSGAGFPSIPLKILYPNISLTIIEPTLKRCNFLKNLVKILGLKDVTIINDRAESITDKRSSFDIVCARAVASLSILMELCTPLVKVNGLFVSMKGSFYQEELKKSDNAMKELNINIEKIFEYELPKDMGLHSILVFKKNGNTKKIYPRHYSTIKNKPL